MPILLNLSSLALKQVLEGACKAVGFVVGEHAFDSVSHFLTQRFLDHSLRLPHALQRANDNTWKALEVALAGESFWSWLDKADQKAFRQQVRTFLDTTPLASLPSHGPEFRTICLRELREARKKGLLTSGTLDPTELARQTSTFARYADPQSLIDAEWKAVEDMAEELRQAGHGSLAHLVALRSEQPGSVSVLVAGVRFFFRREVETDRELFQGLSLAKLEALEEASERGFTVMAELITTHGQKLEEILAGVEETVLQTHTAVTNVQEIVGQAHGAVLDVQAEQGRQGQQLQEIYRAVLEMKRRHDLGASEIRPRDSLAIGSDSERRLVKMVIEKFRALPADQQKQLPALLNSLAQLEVAAGDFDAAQRDFQEVAGLVTDRAARAEAHWNLYGAALEKGDWQAGLDALRQAAELQPARFAPFPLSKYEPERILGAGGFGVAFLCRNRHSGIRLVVKALRTDSLERQVADVFREARVLEELEHPAIIRLRDCDFADSEQTRPYLVMDYFDGPTLEDHVTKNGPLSAEQLLPLARQAAEALQAAHTRGILHRDVKPANLLVRPESGGSSPRWRVKLIDFGLALRQSVLSATAATSLRAKTITGYSIAGTLDYAAPEQMGKLAGVAVGPATDVYGFGKTCCFALFRTTQPLRKHWREIPEELADLLEQCLQEAPGDRFPGFDAVLKELGQLTQPAPVPHPTPTPAPKTRPEPPAEQPRERWWAAGGAATTKTGVGEVLCLEGHTDAVLAVAFSPDGRRILSGGADGTVRLWETETGNELGCMLGHRDKVWSVAFAPGGKQALSAGKDKTVRLWDLERGREARCFEGRTNRSVALSPDGQYAITGSLSDGMVRLWQADTGRELSRFKGHMSWVLAAAFTPDSRSALTGSADGTVRLWEVASGRELRRLQGHKDQVLSVAVSGSRRQALSGSADQSVRLWDLKSGKEVRVFEAMADQVWSVAFAPDGRFGLWECADAAALQRPGQLWESADWVLVLWHLDSGKEVQRFRGHTSKIMSVAFSPDGRLALSGGMDRTIRLWRLPT